MAVTPSQLEFTAEVEAATPGDQVPNPPAGSLALFPNQNNVWYQRTAAGVVSALVPPAYTDEQAQDAIGSILVDSPTVDWTYDDPTPRITARTLNPFVSRVTGASKSYALADNGTWYERLNGGAAMTDTLPTLSAADNGYTVGVHNKGTAVAETITFTGAGGEVIGDVATSYTLQYACRQTFIWTGTKWLFGAGNGNLTKTPTAGITAGSIPTFADTTGRQLGVATSAQLAAVSNDRLAIVNVVDYGADLTGVVGIATALNNAIASFAGAGGVVMFPPGTYLDNTGPYVVAANNITLWAPGGSNATVLKTTNTTGDQLRLTGYGCRIVGFNLQGPGTGTTSNKTSGIGLDVQSQEGYVGDCSFAYQFDALRIGGGLVDVENVWVRYFKANGIVVDHNSDHRIDRVSMVNNAATLPTGAGIDVRVTASLVLTRLNIIASNWALNLSPGVGVTVPSVKATDCFFDTSAIGLRMAGAGSVFRSEFTNCWFSSMSQYGILMAPSTAGANVDGLTFVNCDIYNNVAGTTVGVAVTTANVGKWKMVGCSIAGWTDGIAVVGGNSHFPTILTNTIGAVSAFGVNGTGVRVAAGTYKGFVLQGNDVVDNTTALVLGAITAVASYANVRLVDNPGINPRGAVTTPAVGASTVAVTNTTGFRVAVHVRNGTTAPTAFTVNGVVVTTFVSSAVSPTSNTFFLDPGGTMAFTYTVVPTWVWVAN